MPANLFFVFKQILCRLHGDGINLDLDNRERWQLVMYDVNEKYPNSINMRFDWDGRYPTSPEVDNFLHSVKWTGCATESALLDSIYELWNDGCSGMNHSLIDFVVEEFTKDNTKPRKPPTSRWRPVMERLVGLLSEIPSVWDDRYRDRKNEALAEARKLLEENNDST